MMKGGRPSKLDPGDIKLIRELRKHHIAELKKAKETSVESLAQKFDVSTQTIRRAIDENYNG